MVDVVLVSRAMEVRIISPPDLISTDPMQLNYFRHLISSTLRRAYIVSLEFPQVGHVAINGVEHVWIGGERVGIHTGYNIAPCTAFLFSSFSREKLEDKEFIFSASRQRR